MGALLSYFKSLKPETAIDRSILETINGHCRTYRDRPVTPFVKIGHDIAAVQCTYIPWIEGHISYCNIDASFDVISLPFSGCYLAKVRYMSEQYTAFHIHMGGGSSRKDDWNEYMSKSADIKEVTLCRPDDLRFRIKEFEHYDIWGLISDDNRCFAIAVDADVEAEEQTGSVVYSRVVFKGLYEIDRLPETIE